MKIVNTKENKQKFKDLQIGQVYVDNKGNTCIKTSNTPLDEEENYIYFDKASGKWKADSEEIETLVLPLNAELRIS
jgi:hypothetical protein